MKDDEVSTAADCRLESGESFSAHPNFMMHLKSGSTYTLKSPKSPHLRLVNADRVVVEHERVVLLHFRFRDVKFVQIMNTV